MLKTAMAGARAIERKTVGEILKQKQNRVENLRNTDEVLAMRAKITRKLTPDDYRMVGQRYNVAPAILHTIADKESGARGGFGSDGRLTIMCEPQWFSKLTARAYDTIDPPISYPNWIKWRRGVVPPGWKKHPLEMTQSELWMLWTRWAELDFSAACQAISVGRFQVMGFHWKAFGLKSPRALIEYGYTSEQAHLDMCVRWFITNNKLEALRSGDWFQIAIYNGTGNQAEYAAACRDIFSRRRRVYMA